MKDQKRVILITVCVLIAVVLTVCSACGNRETQAPVSEKERETTQAESRQEETQWHKLEALQWDVNAPHFSDNLSKGVLTLPDESDSIFFAIENQRYIPLGACLFESDFSINDVIVLLAFYWCEYQGEICIAQKKMPSEEMQDYSFSAVPLRHQTKYVVVELAERQTEESLFLLCNLENREIMDLNSIFLEDAKNSGGNEIHSLGSMVFNGKLTRAAVFCNKSELIFCWNLETHYVQLLREIPEILGGIKICWISDDVIGFGQLSANVEKQKVDFWLFDTQSGEWVQTMNSAAHFRHSYTEYGLYFGSEKNCLYIHPDGTLSICDLATGEKKTVDGVTVQEGKWKSDGRNGLFWDDEKDRICLIDLETGQSHEYSLPQTESSKRIPFAYKRDRVAVVTPDGFFFTE